MASIRGKDTAIEIRLRKALYHRGYRYRKNVRALPGTPDIVLLRYKVCIFCDGDFFHGYDRRDIDRHLSTNKAFWMAKIERNRERDEKVNLALSGMGYVVLRYWEHEIEKDLERVLSDIDLACRKREREER